MKYALFIFVIAVIAVSVQARQTPGQLNQELIARYQTDFHKQPGRQTVVNAVTNNDLSALALNRQRLLEHDKLFNFKLKSAGITNQQSSGRCWLFAGMNVFAPSLMSRLKLSSFEFSESYLAFWDKMEKANLFLEQIIKFRDKPIDDRRLDIVLSSPFGDGGWWQYVTSLINKYGVVPKTAMPETKQSSKTSRINQLAAAKLRSFAAELRELTHNGKNVMQLRQRKSTMLSEIYRLMAYNYGEPPSQFTFRYEGKDSVVSDPVTYSPREFRQQFLGDTLPDYVTIMNYPGKAYEKPYRLEGSRNIVEDSDLVMLNLPINRLREYAKQALFDSQAVWFACDVGKEHCRDSALLMTGIYDYAGMFGMDFEMTKAQRVSLHESTPNHAMVFLGVDTTDAGAVRKWLVENSWGKKRGDKGFWYMYDDWFDSYVYMVIIERRMLTPEDQRALRQKPVLLPMWDPMAEAMR